MAYPGSAAITDKRAIAGPWSEEPSTLVRFRDRKPCLHIRKRGRQGFGVVWRL